MDPRILTLLNDDHFALEQYRKICTKIHLACDPPEKNCLMITSSVPAEGKSLSALNLAIAIAQGIRREVILIDGDLRYPRLPDFLDIHTDRGLINYLHSNSDFTEDDGYVLESLIQPTGIDYLSLIPAGGISTNPLEILNSRKLAELMAGLKRKQRDSYIIMDSPPVIPASDPVILSQYADWIIYVILAGKTPRETVRKGIESLEGGKILGVILNDMEFMPYEYPDAYRTYYYNKTAKG